MIIDVGESLDTRVTDGRANLALSGDKIDVVGAGHSSENDYVVQLTAAGQLDRSFGTGGIVKLAQGSLPSLAVQPDGKLVVASNSLGSSPRGINVTRLLTNGLPDTGFGTAGTANVLPMGPYSTAVQVDPLGRFVIAGFTNTTPSWFDVIRLTPTGALDSTFGSGGLGTTESLASVSGNPGTLNLSPVNVAMALQPDGKTVLLSTNADRKFAAVRFTGDSALQISSFTASANPVTAGSSVTLTASNLTDTNPGATINQVAFYYIDNSGNQHLLGYAAQTSPGVWTLSFSPSTFSLTSGTYTLLAQDEDSYGVFSDPFALTLTVQ
jgi:uncharacterized delta-60 repeat protein